ECDPATVGRPARERVAARGSGLQELRRRRCCEVANIDHIQKTGAVGELRAVARPRELRDVPGRETNVTPRSEVVQVEPGVVAGDADRVRTNGEPAPIR